MNKLKEFINKNKWINNKKIIISIVVIIFMIIILINPFNSKNELRGFENYDINLSMTYDEIKEAMSNASLDTETDASLRYSNIIFCGINAEDIFISFDEETKAIEYISVHYDSFSKDTKEIIQSINSVYENPIHKENYNDLRKERVFQSWNLGNDSIGILTTYTENQSSELTLRKYEDKSPNKKLSSITSDKEYKKIKNRANLEGKPITEAIDKYKAEYDSENSSQESDIIFIEKGKLFGFNADFIYSVESPLSDDTNADYVGKIESVKVSIKLDKKTKKKDVIKKLQELFGKNNKDDGNNWRDLPISILTSTSYDNKIDITISPNEYYFEIDPEYNFDDSTKKYQPYNDVGLEILHCENDTGTRYVESYSEEGRRIISLSKLEIKDHLKYPLTASFGDVSIFKSGSVYIVEGEVTAENGFGVPSKMNYKLYYTKNNGSYEFDFGEIDGELI